LPGPAGFGYGFGFGGHLATLGVATRPQVASVDVTNHLDIPRASTHISCGFSPEVCEGRRGSFPVGTLVTSVARNIEPMHPPIGERTGSGCPP
jgi:hypothetical protein